MERRGCFFIKKKKKGGGGATVTMQDDPREQCLWELKLILTELRFGSPSIFEADGALWLEYA